MGARFNYSICIKVKSAKAFTPVAEIIVPHPYEEQKELDAASATDLSSAGTANCYIVSRGGLYKFKAVKGNSSTSLGNVTSAEIVWETFGTSTAPACFDLIEGSCYKNGYVVFKTAAEFKEGNALIAAKDADGKIIWSWHIWMTDMPQGQVYFNNGGTMMDRNLGAVSTTPGEVGALGLMYQYGRKDPFLSSSSISSAKLAKSSITWPSAVNSDSITGTLEYASEHPTTFIKYNELNNDWFYTDAAAVDTTLWAVKAAPKSVNDPCPYGWRIPDGSKKGEWAVALGKTTYGTYTFDSTNKGIQMGGLLGEDENIWYPAAGILDHVTGSLSRTGSAGVWWANLPYSSTTLYVTVTYVTTNGRFYVYDYGTRGRAYSARCVKE